MIEEKATRLKDDDVICDEVEILETHPADENRVHEEAESKPSRWEWIRKNAAGIAAAGIAAVMIPTVFSKIFNRKL